MFCTHCGCGLPDGAQFCTQCGARLAPPPPPPQEKAQGGTVGATEFFGAPRTPAPPPPAGPAQDPTFDPDLDAGVEDRVGATEFFGGAHMAPPPAGPAQDPTFDPDLDAELEDRVGATEFFGGPRTAPPPPAGPAQDPTFDPDLDAGVEDRVGATEFFGGPRTAPPPPAGPAQDPTFDPDLDAELEDRVGATEFFGAPEAPVPPVQPPIPPVPEAPVPPEAPMAQNVPAPRQGSDVPAPPQTPPPGKGRRKAPGRKSRRGLIIALIVILVAAIGVGVFFLVRALLGGGAGDHIFYLQEGKLMYLAKTGKDAAPVMDGVDAAAVAMTPDGKYAALLLSDGYQLTLCRVEVSKLGRDLSKNLSQLQVIDNEVSDEYWNYCSSQRIYQLPSAQRLENPTAFSLADDGTVYYINEIHLLNRFDGGAPETLAKGISTFLPSQDGSRVLASSEQDGNGVLVLWTAGGVQTIAESAMMPMASDPDLSRIYYLLPGGHDGDYADFSLYCWEEGQSTLIAEKTMGSYQITQGGQVAYLARVPWTGTLSEFVEDDMASQDAAMVRPTYEDYRTTEVYTDFLGNQRERTVTDYDAYQEAYAQYREKENRDRLRSRLEQEDYEINCYALYIQQNGTQTLLCDQISECRLLEEEVFVYQRGPDLSNPPSVPLSQVDDTGDVYEYLQEWEAEGRRTVIADASGEKMQIEGWVDTNQWAVSEEGDLYLIQGDDRALTRYTKAGGYSDPETVTTGVDKVLAVDGAVYYVSVEDSELKAAQAGGEHIFSMTGESVDDTTLFAYGDGTLYAMTYKDQFDGSSLTWPSDQGEWAEVTAGVRSVARLEGDRLVLTATDTRDSAGEGYRLFSWEEGELKVIANGVSGFCCPLTQQPSRLYP